MHKPLLQNLHTALEHLGAIPLYGSPPPLDMSALGEALAAGFQVTPVDIAIAQTNFLNHPLEGMGQSPLVRPFVLSPLPEEFFLIISQSELPKLIGSLLFQQGGEREFSSETLLQSFIEVALLRACHSFNELNPFGNLSAAFAEKCPLPEKGALCHDLAITLGKAQLKIRLASPLGSLRAMRTFYEMDPPFFSLSADNATLPLCLSMDIGQTQLSAMQWQQAEIGDCLLLDRCTFDPKGVKGTALLSSGTTPLFDIRIKDGEAKILDYAMTQKETTMTDEYPPVPQEADGSHAEPESSPLPADKIPLTLTVELARMQMPLEKVMQLKPGNVLNLEQAGAHVHLTAGGKQIARGELVELGEALGVKILKLGD